MGKVLSATVRRLGLIYKILAMLITSVLIVVIFPHTRHGEHYDYKVGGIWRGADLVAPYDYPVMKNAEDVAAEEAAERASATLYYVRNEARREKRPWRFLTVRNLERLDPTGR